MTVSDVLAAWFGWFMDTLGIVAGFLVAMLAWIAIGGVGIVVILGVCLGTVNGIEKFNVYRARRRMVR